MSERETDLVCGGDGRHFLVSERYPQPPYPKMPADVRRWAIHVTGDVVSPSDAILHYTQPLPGDVAKWAAAYRDWSAAMDQWAVALPVNEGGAGARGVSGRGPLGYWRMFGGAWIPNEERDPSGPGVALLNRVKWIWGSGVSDWRMREVAKAVYAHREAVMEADRDLAKALEDEPDRSRAMETS